MYGGSGKLGRGGGGGRGGGPGKRSIHSTFNAPPLHRPSTAPGGRLSVGGGSAAPRKRTTTASAPTNSDLSAAEETFSLVTGNPLDFAMIIRLTPDLVEEIKRVEAQGGTARIKFDANANNTSGNVIDVGGKDFRFTWSRETGDLCDIYEERQSGEDGKGLLVESGCAWRKMNVQRILDESTKNHVKMRSEEAERKLKSRKAIVLDPGNPSMKSQIKALAAAEVNPWKIPLKQKKESPFKKQKGEPPPVGVHSKSVYKSGLSTTTSSKGRPSASSLPSPPEQSGAPASPPGTSILSKGHANLEDSIVPRAMSKVNASGSEKEIPSRVNSGTVQDKPGHKGNLGAKPTDLRSMLISLLMENPKGMSLKALEKAIGDRIPNSVRQIESIIKKIATFQAPGRYFLKPGVELENFKRPSSESGSSPEDNYHQTPGLDDHYNHMPASEPSFSVGMHNEELGGQAELNAKPGEESNSLEKIDILHHSPDLFGEKKVSDNNEGPAGSSSGSGSESDSGSDSSDSRSDSGSRSRSRSKSGSPVGSGSSSDSESDASSNSKEGSDEDVDIMTSDDDKESKHKLQASEPGLSTSPIPWKTPDGGPVHNKINEKQDSHSSDIVEIERDFPDDDQEAVMAVVSTSVPHKEGEKPVEEIKSSSPHHYEHQVSEVYPINLNSERENMVKDGFKHGQSDSSQKTPKGKSKRGSDGKHFDDNSKRSKRFKAGNLAQPQISRGRNSLFSDNPHNTSPDRPIEGSDKGPANQATTRMSRNGTGSGLQKDYNQSISGKSISDFQQLDRRSIDTSAWAKAPAAVERPGKHVESLGSNIKNSERTRDEGSLTQKEKVTRETKEDADYTDEKKEPIFLKEGGFGDRYTTPIDSHYRNHTKLVEEFKEAGSVSNSHTGLSPRDNNRTDMNRYPVIKGRGSILQRELSDLELGELREPLPEETPGFKKQLERKSSFKQLENKPTTLDYWNSDSGKGKPAGRTTAESRKPSPPHPNVGMLSIPEGLSKKKTPEHHAEGFTSSHNRVVQPQPHHLPIVDHAEFGSHLNKLAEASSKYRHGEAGASQQIGLEGNGESCSKVPVSAKQQGQVTKESKKKKSNSMADLRDRRADNALMDRKDRGRKRKVSSSDENSSYSKYEKEEPELKRPIKDFSQYKEYVQEYGEKYDSYCSLNKILESYRSEFNKLGRDLEMAKGRDTERYCKIVRQLKESYRQCGTRHKRLKKIFIVLHEELVHLKQMIKDYAVSYTID